MFEMEELFVAEHMVYYDTHPASDTVAKMEAFVARQKEDEEKGKGNPGFTEHLQSALRILEQIVEKYR